MPPGIRAQLWADPDLGAGNVLTKLVEHGADPAGPGLAFDTAVDGHPAGILLTLGELDAAVRARAAWLHGRGVGPRDPIAVIATTAADHILANFALMRLGAIPAPVNGRLPARTIAEYVRRLGATGLLADAGLLAALDGVDTGTPVIGDLADLGSGDAIMAPGPYRHAQGDPIVITHSSGTTGLPKAVVHAHGTLFASIRHRLSMPLPHGSDRMLSALPSPHSATVIATNLALCNRAALQALSTQDGPAVLAGIGSWRPGLVLGFAVSWAALARTGIPTGALDSVGTWWNTGDAAHETHIRRLVAAGRHTVATRQGPRTRPGSRFIDGLGSTEMGHSMFHITHGPDTERYGRCIGRPHTFVEAEVVDPAGRPLPPGQVGELAVRSPTLAPGYWNDSVTTYRTRLRGFFRTGDLVHRDEAGFYYHVDRAADAVDLGCGQWLYTALGEERVLAACPDVADCTVNGVRADGEVRTDVLLVLMPGADPGADRGPAVRAALGPAVAATVRWIGAVRPEDIPTGVTGKVRKLLVRRSKQETEPAGSLG